MYIFTYEHVYICTYVCMSYEVLWEDARCIFQKYMLSIDLTD